MFQLTLGKTTGKQMISIIETAMKERRKNTGKNVTKVDFCIVADISRNMIQRYARGEKPGVDGIAKVAAGLDKWGFEVNVTMDAVAVLR